MITVDVDCDYHSYPMKDCGCKINYCEADDIELRKYILACTSSQA